MLPLLLLTLLSWAAVGAVIWAVDPLVVRDFLWRDAYISFFVLVFLAWFFLLSLLFNNSRRGFLYAMTLTTILLLQLVRLGNIINVVLLVALSFAIDFYFHSR